MSGFWAGVAAYTIWGLVPIYWKLLQHVPAIQVLGHRIVWSLAVLLILLTARRRDAVGVLESRLASSDSTPLPRRSSR